MSRYCYQCNHITFGEPLFCNYCGRSYNVKLCPRLHTNPRSAAICSQCGSHDLSTPQPKVPLWVPILEFLLRMIPGMTLAAISVLGAVLFILAVFSRPALLLSTVLLLLALGFLWWVWSQIPASFRRVVHRLLTRRREGQTGRQRH
jgi:hypothetical protein